MAACNWEQGRVEPKGVAARVLDAIEGGYEHRGVVCVEVGISYKVRVHDW